MSSSDGLTGDARRNRAFWDSYADEYQSEHDEFLRHDEIRWGLWQLPDRELGILGDVAGLEALELGCGAAQFGLTLVGRGARVVGIDASERQLEHARRNVAASGLAMELVHGSAEALPFEDERFDLVVADHGANRFADPYLWVPECARVLRPRGLLAFSGGTAFEAICVNPETDTWEPRLFRDYFGLRRTEWPDGSVEFELGYGDWIRLFRRSGFGIEALVEVQPPEGASSTYRSAEETEWARRWPMEQIWKVRRAA
jgi:SAM-dependent methyltransferase